VITQQQYEQARAARELSRTIATVEKIAAAADQPVTWAGINLSPQNATLAWVEANGNRHEIHADRATGNIDYIVLENRDLRSERSGADALRGLVGEHSDVAIAVTGTIKQALARELPEVGTSEGSVPALLDAINEAEAFYTSQVDDSWVAQMMQDRSISPDTWHGHVGYAPAGWTGLTDHLRGKGFSDQELLAAGLSTEGKFGLIDRFRDRAMFRAENGFVGRRNPDRDNDHTAGPKYLNSPESAIYHKRETLYDPSGSKSGVPVLLEGPMDALAVIEASRYLPGQYRPVAVCGTAITEAHLDGLEGWPPNNRPDLLLYGLDADPAGTHSANQLHEMASRRGINTGVLHYPDGMDPGDVLKSGGALALATALRSAHDQPLVRDVIDQELSRWNHDDLAMNAFLRVDAGRAVAKIIAREPAAATQGLAAGYAVDALAPINGVDFADLVLEAITEQEEANGDRLGEPFARGTETAGVQPTQNRPDVTGQDPELAAAISRHQAAYPTSRRHTRAATNHAKAAQRPHQVATGQAHGQGE
jgi:DNA primase